MNETGQSRKTPKETVFLPKPSLEIIINSIFSLDLKMILHEKKILNAFT